MKKKLIYILSFVLFITVLYSCTSDGDATNMQMKLRDMSDLKVYVGTPSGATEVDISTAYRKKPITNLDSLKLALGRQYFATPLAIVSDSCSKITYEFLNNKLIYINDYTNTNNNLVNYKQILSPYTFRNDSLFANLSSGSKVYVGLGENEKKIYANIGFILYPKEAAEGRNINQTSTSTVNLKKAIKLSYLNSEADMTNPKDTIVVCNVKFIYE